MSTLTAANGTTRSGEAAASLRHHPVPGSVPFSWYLIRYTY